MSAARKAGPVPPAPEPAGEPSSLTEDLRRLEEVVRQLEREDQDLDRSLALFEEGVGRLRAARARLSEAEARVQKVLEDAEGSLRMEPLDADADAGDPPSMR
ncbi:MAG: exodeoxyribonuclease VII small subunit [Gemmatimonadales bacterium]